MGTLGKSAAVATIIGVVIAAAAFFLPPEPSTRINSPSNQVHLEDGGSVSGNVQTGSPSATVTVGNNHSGDIHVSVGNQISQAEINTLKAWATPNGYVHGLLESFLHRVGQTGTFTNDQLSEMLDCHAKTYEELQTRIKQLEGDDNIESLIKEAQKALAEFDFDKAEKLLDEAEQKALNAGIKKWEQLARISTAQAEAASLNFDRYKAVEHYEKAARRYRTLTKEKPNEYDEEYARSLSSLSTACWKVGYREKALNAGGKCETIHRRLAQKAPDKFLPCLAANLNNLSEGLNALGRHEQAMQASRESVEIYRQLAGHIPDKFLPDLANGLGWQSELLKMNGAYAEALETADEGLEIIKPYAVQYPEGWAGQVQARLLNTKEGIRVAASSADSAPNPPSNSPSM